MTMHCHRFFLLYNITIENKNTQENNPKKNQEKGKNLPSSSRFTFSFLVLSSTFLFQMLFLGIFFFSKKKRKGKKKNNTIEKKRNAEKGRSFPSSSHSTFSLLALISALPLLPNCFKRFFLTSSYSQAEEFFFFFFKCREGKEFSL